MSDEAEKALRFAERAAADGLEAGRRIGEASQATETVQNVLSDAKERAAIRLARFEAFTECVELARSFVTPICDGSAYPAHAAAAETANELADRIEELRSAAKPRAQRSEAAQPMADALCIDCVARRIEAARLRSAEATSVPLGPPLSFRASAGFFDEADDAAAAAHGRNDAQHTCDAGAFSSMHPCAACLASRGRPEVTPKHEANADCSACMTRKRRGFDGQCPACAGERTRKELREERSRERALHPFERGPGGDPRCDECDPSFGCFDGSAACSKASRGVAESDKST